MIQRMIDIRIDHDESQRQLAAAIGYHQVLTSSNSASTITSAPTICWACPADWTGPGTCDAANPRHPPCHGYRGRSSAKKTRRLPYRSRLVYVNLYSLMCRCRGWSGTS